MMEFYWDGVIFCVIALCDLCAVWSNDVAAVAVTLLNAII